MLEWFFNNQSFITWLGIISATTFLVSLLALPWLIGKIPEDYFYDRKLHHNNNHQSKLLFKLAVKIGKNILGLILVSGGLIMLFLPGQGLLTIFMGLFLIDYPKKKLFERRFVKIGFVFKSLNWMRAKGGHSPIKLSED